MKFAKKSATAYKTDRICHEAPISNRAFYLVTQLKTRTSFLITQQKLRVYLQFTTKLRNHEMIAQEKHQRLIVEILLLHCNIAFQASSQT